MVSSFRVPGLVTIAALVSAVFGSAAERPWQMLRTPNFTIVSQLDAKTTRSWAEEFNVFTSSLADFWRIETRYLPPLTFVLFRNKDSFAPYWPARPEGGPMRVAALVSSNDTSAVAAFGGDFADDDTRALIYRGAVHWILSGDPQKFPTWCRYGLAGVYSTFLINEGVAIWGKAVANHLQFLHEAPKLPLVELLNATPEASVFNAGWRRQAFHAQSWGLAHMLLFGRNHRGTSAFDAYVNAVRQGTPPAEAVQSAFGQSVEALERELIAYLRSGRFHLARKKVAESPPLDAPLEPAPPVVVAIALARLACGTGHPDLAHEQLARAEALQPDDPELHAVRALLARVEGNLELAHAASARAVALGSRDAGAWLFHATHEYNLARADGVLDSDEGRKVADLLAHTLELQPNLQHAYVSFGQAAVLIEPLRREDLKVLVRGWQRFPQTGAIALAAAEIFGGLGQYDKAATLVELARATPLSEDEQEAARQLEQRWRNTPR